VLYIYSKYVKPHIFKDLSKVCAIRHKEGSLFFAVVEFQCITAFFTLLGAGLFGYDSHKWEISPSLRSCISENLITDKNVHFVIRINLILANKGNSGIHLVARNEVLLTI
jgi:hypothetical protein